MKEEESSMVLDGTIPSAVSDTGATFAAVRAQDFKATKIPSYVTFGTPTGHNARASYMAKLEHKIRNPERDVHIVPSLKHLSLLSTIKMADANYIAIYNNDEVNFYDRNTVKIKVSEDAVLRGYKCPRTKLWRVPLMPNIINETNDTLILDRPTDMTALNT